MRAGEGIRLAFATTFFSRGWSAALGLLAVPLYLRYLGGEAYGVVGIFASLSVIVSLFDLGLGATLTREMSKASGELPYPAYVRDVARTFELVYVVLALLVAVVGGSLAYLLGTVWVAVESLSRDEVVYALLLGVVALVCQWPGNLYSAGLVGLQRQVHLGVATVALSTLRVAVTLLVVWLSPTLQAFFCVQFAIALLQTYVLRGMFWGALGVDIRAPEFRWAVVRASLGFAGGMAGIALTSVIQTQADKLVLSRVLNLSEFGVYSVIAVLASGLYMAISPLFSVMFPRFSSLVHQGDERGLVTQFLAASQLMAMLIIPPAMLLGVFAREVLYVWTGSESLGETGAGVLLFLIIGNACNGLVNMPYAVQLAYGRTRLMLGINIGSIIFLIPGVWWAASQYGAVGAAAIWALLNLGYLLVLPQILHRRLLHGERSAWYGVGIVLPFSICAILSLFMKNMLPSNLERVEIATVLFFYWGISTAAVMLAMPHLRQQAVRWWKAGRV